MTVDQVAGRVGLHPNTCRFHLDALVKNGLADRSVEQRRGPGRPHTLYAAHPDTEPTGRRSYRLLAEILTACLATEATRPRQAAQRAGQAWGRRFAQRPRPPGRIRANEAVRQAIGMLDELGFAPEVPANSTGQILLHHCPFRETAEEHQDIVCAIHLGLMQGLLDELDAPLAASRLVPFAEPSLCVTDLTQRVSKS